MLLELPTKHADILLAPSIFSLYARQRILKDMDKVDRWISDDPNDYPFIQTGVRETNKDHYEDCFQLSMRFFSSYPVFGQYICQPIFNTMILLHDLGEYFNGDIPRSLQRTMKNEEKRRRKNDEYEALQKYIMGYFPYLYNSVIPIYQAYENWKTTTIFKGEATFMQYIDKLSGTLFYLHHMYVYPDIEPERIQRDVSDSFPPIQHRIQHLENLFGQEIRNAESSLLGDSLELMFSQFDSYQNTAHLFFKSK